MASSLLVCSLILTFVGISMAVTCSERSSFGSYTTYKYCPYRCCGTSSFRYCCGSYSSTVGMSTAVIVGIVIGVLCLVAFVVGVIICCVCCLRSSQGNRGQVMRPYQPHVAVVSTGTTNAAYSPGYSSPAYPGQPQPGTVYPPATAYSPATGSAYPPPGPPVGFAAPPPAYNEATQGYPMPDAKY